MTLDTCFTSPSLNFLVCKNEDYIHLPRFEEKALSRVSDTQEVLLKCWLPAFPPREILKYWYFCKQRCGEGANVDPQGVGDLEVSTYFPCLLSPASWSYCSSLHHSSCRYGASSSALPVLCSSSWIPHGRGGVPRNLVPPWLGELGVRGAALSAEALRLCFYNAELERQAEYRGLGSSPSPTFVSSRDFE